MAERDDTQPDEPSIPDPNPERHRGTGAKRAKGIVKGRGAGGGPKGRKPHPGQFKKGHDPRRHDLVASGDKANGPKHANEIRIKSALSRLLRCDLGQVKDIAEDTDNQNVATLLAANRVMVALSDLGKRSDEAFAQIADRTDGKPHQSHEVKVAQEVDPREVMQDIYKEIGWDEPATEAEVKQVESKKAGDELSGSDEA